MSRDDRRLGQAHVGLVVPMVLVSYVLAQLVIHSLGSRLSLVASTLVEAAVIAAVTSVVLWFVVLRPLRAQGDRERFVAKLHTALQMAESEESTFATVLKALATADVRGRSRLMLADSSEAHLEGVLDTGDEEDPGCTVTAPFECPAIRRAQLTVFPSTSELDTCPFLAEARLADDAERGAVCVPLNVVGRSIGVLQVTAAPAALPRKAQLHAVEAVAEHAGTRIGVLRIMARTSLQAATDPLTGLLNRRSFENRAAALFNGSTRFALAMGDLDHFKRLNDTHGHEAGDRALRVFSRTVRRALRSEDVVSRFGGEEFVLVFPNQDVDAAVMALERAREALGFAIAAGDVPPFTASFGVASTDDAESLDELLRMADAELFRAKRAGRDRVAVHGRDLRIDTSHVSTT